MSQFQFVSFWHLRFSSHYEPRGCYKCPAEGFRTVAIAAANSQPAACSLVFCVASLIVYKSTLHYTNASELAERLRHEWPAEKIRPRRAVLHVIFFRFITSDSAAGGRGSSDQKDFFPTAKGQMATSREVTLANLAVIFYCSPFREALA